ncbi:hypothetical protein ABPG72_003723 [Tetrahymena utriculariae]
MEKMVDTEQFNLAKQKIKSDLKQLIGICAKKHDKSQRNLLNKWFQDSVKNYFLEQYAAPLLIKKMQFINIQQVKRFIHHHVDNKETKFMNLIATYFQYLQQYDQVSAFKKKMLELVISSLNYDNTQMYIQNYNQQKLIRKQFVGLIIFFYVELREQNKIQYSFYEIWNIAFPDDKLEKKKLTKFDVARRTTIQQKNELNNQLCQNFQREEDELCKFKLIQQEENSETKSFINKNQFFQVNQIQSTQQKACSISNQLLHSQYYYNKDKPNTDSRKIDEFNCFQRNNNYNQIFTQIPCHKDLFNNQNINQEATKLVIESTSAQWNNGQFQKKYQNTPKLDSHQNNIQIMQNPQNLDQQMQQQQIYLNNNQDQINNKKMTQLNQMRYNNQFQHSLHQTEYQNNLNFYQNQIHNSQENKIQIGFDPKQNCLYQIQHEQKSSSSPQQVKKELINGMVSQNNCKQHQYLMNPEQSSNNQIILKQELRKDDIKLEQGTPFYNQKNQIFLDQFNKNQEFQQQKNQDLISKNQERIQLNIKQEQGDFIELGQDVLKQKKGLEQEKTNYKIRQNYGQNLDIQQSELRQSIQSIDQKQIINIQQKKTNTIQENKIKLEQDIYINNANQTKIESSNLSNLSECQQIQLNQNQIKVKQECIPIQINNSAQLLNVDNNPLKLISNQLFIKMEERQLSQQTECELQSNNKKSDQEFNVKNQDQQFDGGFQQITLLIPSQAQQDEIKKEQKDLNQTKELDQSIFKIRFVKNEYKLQESEIKSELITKNLDNLQHYAQNQLIQKNQKKSLKRKKLQQSDENNKDQQNKDISINNEEDSIKNSQKQPNTFKKISFTSYQNYYQLNPNQLLLNENNKFIDNQYENKQLQLYHQQLNYQQQIKYQTPIMAPEHINLYGMIQANDQLCKNQYLQNMYDQQYQNHLIRVSGNNQYASLNANHNSSYNFNNQNKNIQLQDQFIFNQQKQYHQQQQQFKQSSNKMQQQNFNNQQSQNENINLIFQQQSIQDQIPFLGQQIPKINIQGHSYQIQNQKIPSNLQ